MRYSNFHTHTTFCDGKNTPREMLLAAITTGCPELGFSGHARTPFDDSYCMSAESTTAYFSEVHRLQKQYSGSIRVFCGIEQDIFSVPFEYPYDYVVGSAHYIEHDGHYLCIDAAPEQQQADVRRWFGGDWYAYTAAAFAHSALVYERTGCQLAAHFDLVSKFNEGGCLFDENDRRYRHAALEALERLAQTPAVLEINTGAIRRGWRTVPYPAPFILAHAAHLKMPVMICSDAHDTDGLLCAFDQAQALIDRFGLHQITDFAGLCAKSSD